MGEPGHGTFISRHGLVQYNRRLGRKYPRTGPCELGLCQMEQDKFRALKQNAEEELEKLRREQARLDARKTKLLAWKPRLDRTKRQRRRELDRARTRLRALAVEAGRLTTSIIPFYAEGIEQWAPERRGRSAMLFFDHCHSHGWVRGMTCGGCNTILGNGENWGFCGSQDATAAVILAYLANCPDCRAPNCLPARADYGPGPG